MGEGELCKATVMEKHAVQHVLSLATQERVENEDADRIQLAGKQELGMAVSS